MSVHCLLRSCFFNFCFGFTRYIVYFCILFGLWVFCNIEMLSSLRQNLCSMPFTLRNVCSLLKDRIVWQGWAYSRSFAHFVISTCHWPFLHLSVVFLASSLSSSLCIILQISWSLCLALFHLRVQNFSVRFVCSNASSWRSLERNVWAISHARKVWTTSSSFSVHSLTHSLCRSFAHSLLSQSFSIRAIIHPCTHCFPLKHSLTHSFTHPITYPCTHTFTAHTLIHRTTPSFTYSRMQPHTHARIHWVT